MERQDGGEEREGGRRTGEGREAGENQEALMVPEDTDKGGGCRGEPVATDDRRRQTCITRTKPPTCNKRTTQVRAGM